MSLGQLFSTSQCAFIHGKRTPAYYTGQIHYTKYLDSPLSTYMASDQDHTHQSHGENTFPHLVPAHQLMLKLCIAALTRYRRLICHLDC